LLIPTVLLLGLVVRFSEKLMGLDKTTPATLLIGIS